VIGQDSAKRTLFGTPSQPLQARPDDARRRRRDRAAEVQHLLLGPTGCGKTLLARRLQRILNVAVRRSPTDGADRGGYVGEDVENILLKLIQAADYDVKKAETGIIYIDEVDKNRAQGRQPVESRASSRRGRPAARC